MARLIVGVSGATGFVLAVRCVDTLTKLGNFVELVMTKDAHLTAVEEMGKEYAGLNFLKHFSKEQQSKIRLHQIHDFTSPLASGSYQVDGMIIIPCSMATLAAIACGLSDNLVRRAADVTIKERRPLVLVPRETPLSEIHLENMLKLARIGAQIVAPMPAWYTQPQTLEDIENFIVGKVLDALKIPHTLYPRWTGSLRSNTKCMDNSKCEELAELHP
jgi:flavin prenyltransferase